MGCFSDKGVEVKSQSEKKNETIDSKNKEIKNSTSKKMKETTIKKIISKIKKVKMRWK